MRIYIIIGRIIISSHLLLWHKIYFWKIEVDNMCKSFFYFLCDILELKNYKKIILSLYKTVVHHQGIQSILKCISHWCDILYGETLFMWKMQICCTKTRYMYIVAIFCKFSLDLKTIFFQAQKLLKKIGIEGVKVMLININLVHVWQTFTYFATKW